MKKIATYLVAILVLVCAFFVGKFVVALLIGTLLKTFTMTLIIGVGALVVVGVGATAVLRKR